MSSRAMQAAVLSVCVVLGGTLITSTSQAGSPLGKVGIESGQAELGETAELTASFTAMAEFDGVGGWSFTVNYNPSVATVVQCQPNIPSADDQQCGGGVSLDQFRFSGTVPGSLLGDFAFGSITFECDHNGTFTVDVEISGILNSTRTAVIDTVASDGVMVCGDGGPPTPTNTATRTPTSTSTPTETQTPANTPTPPPGNTPTPTTSGGLVGDVGCDGTVNAVDAALILQNSAGLLATLPCEENADVSGDGRINALDAALVLQFAAGLVSHLPV